MASSSYDWFKRGSSNDWFGTLTPPANPIKPKKPTHHGLLGTIIRTPLHFTEHLADDVKNAVVGLPTGLITLASHPVRGLEDIGKTTWHDWSPLITGHPDKFIKQFYAHPLAPILDVAAVLTGGVGAAAKATNLITGAEYKVAIGAAERAAFERGLARPGLKKLNPSRSDYVAHGGGLQRADINANLSKLAKWGRPQERYVSGRGMVLKEGADPVGDVAVSLPKIQHANPAIRLRQNMAASLGHGLSRALPSWFGAGAKLRDLSESGEFGRLASKQLSTSKSARMAAVAGQMQIVQMVRAGKLIKDDPHSVAVTMWAHARPQLEDHSLAADPFKLHRTKTKEKLHEAGDTVPKAHATKQVEHANRGLVGGTSTNTSYSAALKQAKPLRVRKNKSVDVLHAPPGYVIVKADRGIPNSTKINTPEDLEHFVTHDFGALNAARKVKAKDAYYDANGQVRLVRESAHAAYNEEALNSTKFVNALFTRPTQVWKGLVLKYSPRYFVNNAVGNTFMFLAMAHPRSIAALAGAYKDLHGDRFAARSASRAEKAYHRYLGQDATAINKWYGETYKHGQFRELTQEAMAKRGGKVRATKLGRAASQGLLGPTHLVAERMIRLASTHSFLKAQPEIRALMSQGYSFEQAINAMSGDIAFRYRVNQAVDDVLGDYHHLTPQEQKIRAFVPFYTWTRAISRHTTKLALNYPARAGFLAREGQLGVERTKDILGDLPDFLKGVVPLEILPFHHSQNTRAGVLTTQGLNPYATISDAVNAVQAITTGNVRAGEAAASQLGPIPAGAIEFMTGTSLLTGAPSHPKGGLLTSIGYNATVNTPVPKLIQKYFGEPPKQKPGKPTLYKKDFQQELYGYLGIPKKELSQKAAQDLYRREKGIRKGRKKAQNPQNWFNTLKSGASGAYQPWFQTPNNTL